jgi:hypothetical protein
LLTNFEICDRAERFVGERNPTSDHDPLILLIFSKVMALVKEKNVNACKEGSVGRRVIRRFGLVRATFAFHRADIVPSPHNVGEDP